MCTSLNVAIKSTSKLNWPADGTILSDKHTSQPRHHLLCYDLLHRFKKRKLQNSENYVRILYGKLKQHCSKTEQLLNGLWFYVLETSNILP